MNKISLGIVVLTPNQKKRLSSLHDNKIKGFFINSKDEVFVNYDGKLNDNQKQKIVDYLTNLSDEDSDQKKDKVKFKNKDKNLSGSDIKNLVYRLAVDAGYIEVK